jgi:hypothetical protein
MKSGESSPLHPYPENELPNHNSPNDASNVPITFRKQQSTANPNVSLTIISYYQFYLKPIPTNVIDYDVTPHYPQSPHIKIKHHNTGS